MRRSRRVEGLAAAQCVSGVLLLACPVAVARAVSSNGPEPPAWLVRLLGARMLAQGAVELARPRRRIVLGGAAIDATHAISMIALAAAAPSYRRAALTSAAAAATSASLGTATARTLQ